MRIAVTGATGFIGGGLVRELVGRGDEIRVLCRSASSLPARIAGQVRVFEGALSDVAGLERAFAGCDAVFHLAASLGTAGESPAELVRTNAGGALAVLDLAWRAGARRIVVTSTAGVFGPSRDGPTDESCRRPRRHYTAYERAKALGDDLLEERIARGAPVVVHPTRVFGPGPLTAANSVTRVILLCRDGRWRIEPGRGRAAGNYAFIGDVVRGHILALERGRPGERYLLGGDNLTYDEFFRAVGAATGRRLRLIRVPVALMLAAAAAARAGAALASRPAVATPGRVLKLSRDWRVSCRKAEAELGYVRTPFAEALRITVDWLDRRYPRDA